MLLLVFSCHFGGRNAIWWTRTKRFPLLEQFLPITWLKVINNYSSN